MGVRFLGYKFFLNETHIVSFFLVFFSHKEVLTDELGCGMLVHRFCNGHSLYGLYYRAVLHRVTRMKNMGYNRDPIRSLP